MEINVPQHIKGYELHERIGAGGFGAVYRAYQSTVGREVALKIILPGLANQPDFIRRFEAEAQLIARLEHPHITPLYDYWRDSEGAFLVMRWLRGGSLRDALEQQGAFDLRAATLLLDQIAGALSLAHRNGVIHRDVKPANILLDEDGNAYLTDFGIAKDLNLAEGNTHSDVIIGSMDYISPEQARSEQVTPRTDIYSLGVTLYEIISGHHPFENVSSVERLYKHINDPLPEVNTFDPPIAAAINRVIQRATAKNPTQRYPDALTFAAEFREAIGVSQPSVSVVELLTQREHDILVLLIEGLSNKEIASRLTITISTVKWYITQIYDKLGVRSRMQAIVRARELNLLTRFQESPTVIAPPTEDFHPENPYKGLRAFRAADFQDFFGREKITSKLLQQLKSGGDYARFLAVVGPSGSGKSSLVRAGLIPALWRGDLPGSEKWFIVDMLPGARPLDELEIALTKIAANHGGNLNEQLRRDQNGLLRAASLILPDDDSELVLVIDQFEEIFTLVADETLRSHFLDLLYAAVTEPRTRIRVVVTLRADFYDRPLHYLKFGEMLRSRLETIMPLSAEELEQVIVRPAERVGVTFEQGLVASIVGDVNYQPGALPLLQYALTELFEQRQGRLLTREAYQNIGGTVGALAKRADELYLALDNAGQEAAHQMFLRLVTLGEGGGDTRRRVARSELLAITTDADCMDEVIDTFAAYRLLSLDHDHATRTPTVEVAHEAILREWDRLRSWLNESREDIRQQRELAALATDWQAHEQDGAYLARESRLERLRVWADDTEFSLTPLERAYLAACIAAEAQRLDDKQAQIERENRLRHHRQRILQGLVAVFLFAAVVAGMLAWEANKQSDKARDAQHEALRQASIGLAASARDSLENDVDRQTGVLLALEAVEHYPLTPQAVGALALAVERYRPHRHFDSLPVMGGATTVGKWSPDGTRIAGGGRGVPNAASVVIWDAAAGEIELSTNLFDTVCGEPQYWMYDLEWSPDGERLAGVAKTSESGDGCGIVVIDSATAETLLTVDDPGSPAWSLDWSPDGTTLVTGHEDGIIRLWDADSGMAKAILTRHEGIVYSASFSPDSKQIATASGDGTVRLWDVATGEEQMVLRGHAGSVNVVYWSLDGTYIVSGGFDALPRVWDVATGQTLFVLAGHTEPIVSVSWSDNGRQIASHSLDATVRIWDAATGGFISEIDNIAPSGNVKIGFAEFDPNSQWVVTGGGLITGVELWDVTTSVPLLFGHSFGQEWGGWSPNGTLIATAGTDGSARLWDAATGEQVGEFDQGSYYSDWSPDGTRLVFAEGVEAPALNVWDVASGRMLARLAPDDDGLGDMFFYSADWSPNGEYITAAGGRSGTSSTLFIWDTNTFELSSAFLVDDNCTLSFPKWSPDSTRIVTGCLFVQAGTQTAARVWDVKTGEIVMKLENPNEGWTYYANWSPDGTKILTTHDGDTVVIWDAESGEPILTFTEHQGGTGTAAEFSPDGTLVSSRGFSDRQLKIWDAETGKVVMSFIIPGSALNVAWSPDSRYILISGDGLIEPIIKRVWRSTDDLVAYAYQCCVFRDLTPQERAQFGLPERSE